MNENEDRQKQLEEQDRRIDQALNRIHRRMVVFSGKGGVGKTTVAVNLAHALKSDTVRVGLLDADITGPNVPKMTGAREPHTVDEMTGRIIPAVADDLQIISIASMVPPDAPVIWRGPLRAGTITQFLADVAWGDLDYLLADLPPGTGDEVLTTSQKMLPQMAVIVTTPQEVSLLDCRRAVNMAKKLRIPKIGVVENMSGLICPHCDQIIDLFGSGGGEAMAREMGVQFLGKIPMEVETREAGDQGRPVVLNRPDSPTARAFGDIAKKVDELFSL